MKKLFALILVLCLVCTASAVSAEVLQADGSSLTFDGFTLNLDAGVYYILNERVMNQVYVQVYPYFAVTGDDTINFNAVWTGTTGALAVDDVQGMVPAFETSFKETYAAAGYTLESIAFDEACEGTLGGKNCVVLQSHQLVVDPSENGFEVFQRQFYIGSNGFIFTATGRTPEALEDICGILENALSWQ